MRNTLKEIPGGTIRGETSMAYAAFQKYRDMEERSLRQLAQTLSEKEGGNTGAKQGQLEVWSTRYKWVKRCQEWDEYQDAILRQTHLKEIAQMSKRQAEAAKRLQEKGLQKIEKTKPAKMSFGDATRAVVEGAKLERLARGESQSIQDNRVEVVFTIEEEGGKTDAHDDPSEKDND
ncbi:MAG: hypothetical protein Q8P05_02830 [Candidatus Diapherotrites archaeon]|nr:hypothetical protein [Candidatus Diapherotrites archaeon]